MCCHNVSFEIFVRCSFIVIVLFAVIDSYLLFAVVAKSFLGDRDDIGNDNKSIVSSDLVVSFIISISIIHFN